jgi:hypothetical protein
VCAILAGLILVGSARLVLWLPSPSAFLTAKYDCCGQDLRGAALPYAPLRGVNLRRAKLQGANLFHANLAGTILSHTDFAGANLSGATLDRAIMADANLRGANLKGAHLDSAVLEGARYDRHTCWPAGFDPHAHGAVLVSDPTGLPSRDTMVCTTAPWSRCEADADDMCWADGCP